MAKPHKSYEVYDKNLLLIRWLADFCGVDMMVENYKFNYRAASVVAVLIMGSVGSVYSLIHYYPDYYKMCEAVIPPFTIIQAATKFYYGYVHREFYRRQYGRLRDLHYRNRNHERNHADLLWLMERIYLATKVIAVLFFGVFVVGGIYPIFMYLYYGERVLIIAWQLPGVNPESTTGYAILIGIELFMTWLAVTGIAAADVAIILFVASLIAYVSVFTNELDELDDLLSKDPRDEQLIKEKVRLICTQHQDIIEYESDLDERYIVICFVQVLTSIGGMSAILFLVYMTNYIPAYSLLVVTFCQFFEICSLGTILTVKNEEIIIAIYRANWYLLKKPEQKCLALMLHKSQHFVEITVGGFAPLNLETFVAIMNRIYSYSMMLINFIE